MIKLRKIITNFCESIFCVKNEGMYKIIEICNIIKIKKLNIGELLKSIDEKQKEYTNQLSQYVMNAMNVESKRIIDIINQNHYLNEFQNIKQLVSSTTMAVNKINETLARFEYKQNMLLYQNSVDNIRKRIQKKNKVRVAFMVVYSSVFPTASLYEKMLQDDIFEPFIVVIPDIARSEENMFFQMEKTYTELSKKYYNVKLSYDKSTNTFIDFSEEIDMMFTANPYDELTNELYRIEPFILKKILTFYTPYSWYGLTNFNLNHVVNNKFHNSVYKLFLESKENVADMSKIMTNLGSNLILTGYCKMDMLSKVKYIPRTRKRIIIAPHHTILHWDGGLNISTFLKYYDFFVELPKKYPNIDFVFRPHPLLFVALKRSDVWGEDKVQKYLEDLTKNPNITYDSTDDYFDLLVNSDAMIHDCGSFKAEYMYTDHPQCYLIKDKTTKDREFSVFGKDILKHTYLAYSEQDILDFINNVVINGNDTMKNDRINFANKYLKINYPHATDKMLECIKKELS